MVVIQFTAKISVALELQLKVSSIGSVITWAIVCLADEAILLCVLEVVGLTSTYPLYPVYIVAYVVIVVSTYVIIYTPF